MDFEDIRDIPKEELMVILSQEFHPISSLIIALFYNGIDVEDIMELKIDNVNFKEKELRYNGKTLPLSNFTMNLIKESREQKSFYYDGKFIDLEESEYLIRYTYIRPQTTKAEMAELIKDYVVKEIEDMLGM